jgi:hypothetical protein
MKFKFTEEYKNVSTQDIKLLKIAVFEFLKYAMCLWYDFNQ